MGTLTLPTPLVLAGGAVCVVGGYLIASSTAPSVTASTSAVVASVGPADRICLRGEAVRQWQGVDGHGLLCGTWSHAPGESAHKGDAFVFAATAQHGGVRIYGGVRR